MSDGRVFPSNMWVGRLRGVLWAQIAVTIFTFVFAAGKFLHGAVPPFQIILLRYAAGCLCLLMVMLKRRQLNAMRSTAPLLQLLRAAAGATGLAAALYAATHLALADATIIGLSENLFLLPLAALLLREKIGLAQWLAVVVAGLGAAIVILGAAIPSFGGGATVFPALVALGGAFLFAVEFVLIKLIARSDSALTMLVCVNFFGLLLAASIAVPGWQSMALADVLFCLALGPVALYGQYCNIRAVHFAGPGFLAPFGYSWAIDAALLGWIFFGERLSAHTLYGAILIIGPGLAIAVHEWRSTSRLQPQA
ncbi:MAG TPA: DMT family transporter [Dongiaceae bacterium]|nr:DMT family transporter [Dongiaceae bacterium]